MNSCLRASDDTRLYRSHYAHLSSFVLMVSAKAQAVTFAAHTAAVHMARALRARGIAFDEIDVDSDAALEARWGELVLKISFPGMIRWNFAAKFLVNRDGRIVKRSRLLPMQLELDVVELLQGTAPRRA